MGGLLDGLVASLREELQQYGELLALLDRQPDFPAATPEDGFRQLIAAIQDQVALIEHARVHREGCQSALAATLGQPSTVPIAALVSLLPEDYQHLVVALVQENDQLLLRAQHRVHQNHLLMSRSAALMKRFLSGLPEPGHTETTRARGQSSALSYPFPVTPEFAAVS